MARIALLTVACLVLRAGFAENGSRPHALAYQYGLIALASLAGVERAAHGPARRRPFWAGFAAAGLLGATSQDWGVGPVAAGWFRLISREDRAIAALTRRFPALACIHEYRALHFLAGSLMFCPPALAAGLAGGLAFAGLARLRHDRVDGVGTDG